MQSTDAHAGLISYLRQADATFRNGFESEEMKGIFLQNTFEEIIGEEVPLCLDKSSSFILEDMIKEASMKNIIQFFEALKNDCWLRVARNRAGCHIIEGLCCRLISLLHRGESMEHSFVNMTELHDLVGNSIQSTIADVYSTHGFRAHVQMLGGMHFAKKNETYPQSDIVLGKKLIPKGFLKTLQKICRVLCEIPENKFVELLCDTHASPCIACLLKVASLRELPKTLKRLCSKMASCCVSLGQETSRLFILMKDRHGSHVIEALLEYGNIETVQTIMNIIIEDQTRFFELCAHSVANFVIQKMISCIKEAKCFEQILNILLEGLEDVLADQNYGVVQRLAEQCLTFTNCQEKFFNRLLEAFHCESADTRKYIVVLLATLTALNAFFKSDDFSVIPPITSIEYHGSLLLQTLLKFKNIGLIVKGLCEIPAEHFVALACNANGSHFIDAFFKTEKVKPKKKRELIENIKDKLPLLACDKYGSRVLENIWNVSDISEKKTIAKSLSAQVEKMSSDVFGKFIIRKFSIYQYQNRKSEWETFQKKNSNKRKMFAGIISEKNHVKRRK